MYGFIRAEYAHRPHGATERQASRAKGRHTETVSVFVSSNLGFNRVVDSAGNRSVTFHVEGSS